MRSEAYVVVIVVMFIVVVVVVEMVLGPLLVKEGHGMGEMAGRQLAQIASKAVGQSEGIMDNGDTT